MLLGRRGGRVFFKFHHVEQKDLKNEVIVMNISILPETAKLDIRDQPSSCF
jgi:hypothetical protein